MLMKRALLATSMAVLCTSVGVIGGGYLTQARAATAPTPEVDRANANLQLKSSLKSVSCTGEDSVSYVTYSGQWKGSESQTLPDPTDYNLTGTLTVSKIEWTINTASTTLPPRGVLTGVATLTNSAGGTVYVGQMILVTNGLPVTGAAAEARGWIEASIKQPDDVASTTKGDDFLIANVELEITVNSAIGLFGDNSPGTLGYPDFSAVTNVAPKAADGVC
jgi:hypothetical protein